MSQITTTTVTNDHLGIWGAKIVEYNYDKHVVDFQDLMVKITEKRAACIESEVTPLSKRMENRNKRLSDLGAALADISKLQANLDSDAEGGDPLAEMQTTTHELVKEIWKVAYPNNMDAVKDKKITKATAEAVVQLLKTQIDLLNNASSEDMTRLQGIVDKRDQSYSTATTLMQEIADTRSTLVKNL